MKVLSIFLAFAAVAVTAEKYHYHNTCDTNGVFACSDDWQSLLQCGYVRGNVLAWRFHSTCTGGTECVDDGPNGFVGCA
ncbi:hypothetical protein HDU99_009930 [Rhizoclosmatium hyalinum]|nr:hypothetical protein HDU99_009930 [Rhizoclosmatium hyalinum]